MTSLTRLCLPESSFQAGETRSLLAERHSGCNTLCGRLGKKRRSGKIEGLTANAVTCKALKASCSPTLGWPARRWAPSQPKPSAVLGTPLGYALDTRCRDPDSGSAVFVTLDVVSLLVWPSQVSPHHTPNPQSGTRNQAEQRVTTPCAVLVHEAQSSALQSTARQQASSSQPSPNSVLVFFSDLFMFV